MRTFSTMALTSAVAASMLLASSTVVSAQSRTIEGNSVTMTVTSRRLNRARGP